MSDKSTDPVDTHDPAGMARWLRERRDAALEFYKLDSEAQQRQFLQRWQQYVLPHLAFRFGQAAVMIEQLAKDVAIQAVNAKTVTDLQAEIEGMRSLIRRVIDWEPAFPVESSLLDELAAAVKHPDVSGDKHG